MTDPKVLEERLRALGGRVSALEEGRESQREQLTQILVAIGVLQTRVTLYAAGIGTVVSLIVSVAVKLTS